MDQHLELRLLPSLEKQTLHSLLWARLKRSFKKAAVSMAVKAAACLGEARQSRQGSFIYVAHFIRKYIFFLIKQFKHLKTIKTEHILERQMLKKIKQIIL